MSRSTDTPPNGHRRPAISAHRGGSDLAPPATWEAYRDAPLSGAEYVEFDIRRTKDGVFVVYHDARLDHTGPRLATLTHAAANDLAGYELPEVGKVMELAAESGLVGHLDLKETGDERAVVGQALDVFGVDGFVATTLEDASIAAISRDFPDVRTALSVGRNRKEIPLQRLAAVRRSEFFPLRRVRACGAKGLAIHQQMAKATVLRQCAVHGLFAMVWTVNDDEGLRHFLGDDRVDVLITDRPRRALTLRDSDAGHEPRPVG
ncbi:glycerophosphodiester phosphodiesterase [Streptomyces sp. HNM0575]|uniref:glycerophosphodiester phosphodiesterase family protein n=1 Tax=Streptomyces sp. HNM0575 TaxID=2716338 RepID=UPI00145ED83A|nr:glycerophosphodiester phosphodiesterase family protein [Streptomyces sp. HNM0575]NLU74145.1 glycerophosphodiester phosphodiesterase [Streptomyces sp. HNM0575]